MDNRILRDIRYYERKPENYEGKYDGILGNVYQKSPDIKYIGQRIARKLNELGFITGEFDHIYLNLSPQLKEGEIIENHEYSDKRILQFNYGLNPINFNKSIDDEKDLKIKQATFQVLQLIYKNDDLKLECINHVKYLTDKYEKQLIISYKTKETNKYCIKLSFQIRPINDKSKLLIEYTNKIDGSILHGTLDILDYEDLYYLIDSVIVKDGKVIFLPKKSFHAEFVSKRYNDSFEGIEINNMIKR